MLWKVLSRTLQSVFGIGGLVLQGFGIYFDVVQATQTPTILGVSILYIGAILFAVVAISAITQLWWHIHRIEAPMEANVKELKKKIIHQDRDYSMLEIFDALRDNFALGVTYPQVHGVLVRKLYRDAAWGSHSSDILAMFTQLGLIDSPTIDPSNLAFIDYQRSIPNYVYKLTDKGNSLAHKLMNQKPKVGTEGSLV
jgi:hypothetical protein